MRRVIIMLDLSETEAERFVEVLAPVASEWPGVELREGFDYIRAIASPENRGMTLEIRSTASTALLGPNVRIAKQEIPAQ